MSKTHLLGLAVLGCGALVGFLTGGPFGLALAAICLVVGLVYFVASEARRTTKVGAQATRPAHQKTEMLFLIKEAHCRPQRDGKFREILDPNELHLDFEIFLYCWLINETELPIRIVDGPHLTLRRPASAAITAERVPGDLAQWRLGKLNQEKDSSDLLVLRAEQETVTDFNTLDALECGVPVKGWLHFRVGNISPADLKASSFELAISDSLGNFHLSSTSGPRFIPGRMWPCPPAPTVRRTDTYPGIGPLATGS